MDEQQPRGGDALEPEEQARLEALTEGVLLQALERLLVDGGFEPFSRGVDRAGLPLVEPPDRPPPPRADSAEQHVEALLHQWDPALADGRAAACAVAYDALLHDPGSHDATDAIAVLFAFDSGRVARVMQRYRRSGRTVTLLERSSDAARGRLRLRPGRLGGGRPDRREGPRTP